MDTQPSGVIDEDMMGDTPSAPDEAKGGCLDGAAWIVIVAVAIVLRIVAAVL